MPSIRSTVSWKDLHHLINFLTHPSLTPLEFGRHECRTFLQGGGAVIPHRAETGSPENDVSQVLSHFGLDRVGDSRLQHARVADRLPQASIVVSELQDVPVFGTVSVQQMIHDVAAQFRGPIPGRLSHERTEVFNVTPMDGCRSCHALLRFSVQATQNEINRSLSNGSRGRISNADDRNQPLQPVLNRMINDPVPPAKLHVRRPVTALFHWNKAGVDERDIASINLNATLTAQNITATVIPDGSGYQTTYVDYRVWSQDGKGAARYFDRLDVDGDGTPELILEVVGDSSVWIATLKREDVGWTESYRDSCGLPAPVATRMP